MKSNEEQHFVTGKYVFPSIFYYHISKSVLRAPLQRWRFFLFFSQHWTSPFIITHRTLTVNHHSSHGKLDVPHNGEKLRPSELRHICTSWVSCFISTHSTCQLENEGLNLNWWFTLAQLSHQLCSHILLVFSLWPMLTKLCHPLIRMGGWCLAQMCTAACNPQNKCSQLRSVSSLCCLTTEG